MQKKTVQILVPAIACAVASVGNAQEPAPEAWRFDALVHAPLVAASMADAARMFVSSEIAGARVVKGAPYAANAVSETIQTLADGNRIVRSSTNRLARDGEGRTRQERSDGSVFLFDPVAGKSWLLLPKDKSAVELPRPMRMHMSGDAAVHHSAEEMRSWADAMRVWAHEFSARWRDGRPEAPEARREGMRAPAAPPAPGDSRVIVARAPQAGGDVRSVEIVSGGEVPPPPRPGAPPVPPHPPSTAPLPPAAFDVLPLAGRLPREGGVTTSLGKRDFDGVSADGTRTTWTIPAGRIGNEKPIEIASERWYAPDLMLVVHTRHLDPRSGESTYRLAQIKRGEPDASLFKVPADYTVRAPRERRSRPESSETK